ncbi:hypothetical protein JCGZ_04283 [Jatropha curcas]|uniref:EF-hand domain-containing protein n=1 Tax=Jatropha curcas TaxID=180498 RepID=A0A067KTR3_JATCU|nr:hypothetical protein JCGZ_04283 [Jatropha curcas]
MPRVIINHHHHKTKGVPKILTENELKRIFMQFDVNRDSVLSKEEIKKAFEYLGAFFPGFRANRGIRYADANGDGQVDLTELDDLFNVIINMLLFNDVRLNKLIELEHSGKARLIIIQGESNNHQDYYDSGHILKVSIEKESFNVNEVVTKMYNLLNAMRENAKSHNKLIRQPTNDHLHELFLSKEPRTNKVLCRSCSKIVSGLSYECAECNEFTFHKLCAESSPDVKNCPLWLREMKPKQYDFQKTYKCNNCEEFSEDCYDCLFQTNVSHGFLPTILHHQRHQHFLNFIIMPFQYNYQYKCCICDKLGSSVSYKCYDCNYDVHVKCILPSTIRMPGHGYYSLVSASSYHQDELEKYNCGICREKIESSQLLYWCEEQDFIRAGTVKGFTNQYENFPIHVKCMPSPKILTENELKRIFMQFDVNRDSVLSKEEIKKAFEYLGAFFPGFRANRGIRYADANGDGQVDLTELDDLVNYAVRLGYSTY